MRFYAKVRSGKLFVSVIAPSGSKYTATRALSPKKLTATGLLKSTGRRVVPSVSVAA